MFNRKYSINVFFLRYRFIFKPMLRHNSFVDYIWNAAFSQPCFFSACPNVMPAQNPRIFHQQVVKVNTTEQHNSRREWEKKAFCSFLLIHTHGALQHKAHIKSARTHTVSYNSQFPSRPSSSGFIKTVETVCVRTPVCVPDSSGELWLMGKLNHTERFWRSFKVQTLLLVFIMSHSY